MSEGIYYVSSSIKAQVGNTILTFNSSSISGSAIEARLYFVRNNTNIITSSTTLTDNMYKILVNAINDVTISFPSASLYPYKEYIIKNKDAAKASYDLGTNKKIVTLNLMPPKILNNNSIVRIVNDGINWYAFNIR